MALQVVQTPDIAGGNIGGIGLTAFRVLANRREEATEIAKDRLGNYQSFNRRGDQLKLLLGVGASRVQKDSIFMLEPDFCSVSKLHANKG